MFNTIPAVPFTPPYYRSADVRVTFFYASDFEKQEAYDKAHQALVRGVKRHATEERLRDLQERTETLRDSDVPDGKEKDHETLLATAESTIEQLEKGIASEYGDLASVSPTEEIEARAKLIDILVVKVKVGDEERAWPETLENQMALLRSFPIAAMSEVIDGLFYEAYDPEAQGKS